MQLKPLCEHEWPALHRLMVARKFPHVPARFADAVPQLRQATLLGLGGQGGLQAAFVFGPAQDGVAFFDAVCSRTAAGKWATRPLLQALFSKAFTKPPAGMGLRCLWVQPHGTVALRAALAAGFQAVTPIRRSGEPPVLVLTPTTMPRIYQPNQGDQTDGKPV